MQATSARYRETPERRVSRHSLLLVSHVTEEGEMVTIGQTTGVPYLPHEPLREGFRGHHPEVWALESWGAWVPSLHWGAKEVQAHVRCGGDPFQHLKNGFVLWGMGEHYERAIALCPRHVGDPRERGSYNPCHPPY